MSKSAKVVLVGITAPGILSPTVMRRVKKRKNLSSARHYDQIRFRFHTAKTHSGSRFGLGRQRRPLMLLKGMASPRWSMGASLSPRPTTINRMT